MLFRINHENFIYHMIDYFTREELVGLQYLIISGPIRNQGTAENVARCNDLYPTSEIVSDYVQLEDMKVLHKAYYKELKQTENIVYRAIIEPILRHHHNIVIVCKEREDMYIDVLCDFLKKEFNMQTIDLNRLFKEGETDIFFIDRDSVNNKSVELKRTVVRDKIRAMEQTEDGRAKLLSMMSKDDKLDKLKELGIKVNKSDKKDLDELLRLEWVISGE
jgi:hypothetical protein